MREVIIREWRDDIGMIHRDEVGELVRLEKGLKMLWEASDETCKNIEVAGEKILEISNGWYIDKVACPDKKWGKDMNSLIIEIRRDSKKEICKGVNMDIIRKDCFWYRPWTDMSATIDQCHFHATGECHCCEDCEMFITKKKVDEIIEWFVDIGRPWMERTL